MYENVDDDCVFRARRSVTKVDDVGPPVYYRISQRAKKGLRGRVVGRGLVVCFMPAFVREHCGKAHNP